MCRWEVPNTVMPYFCHASGPNMPILWHHTKFVPRLGAIGLSTSQDIRSRAKAMWRLCLVGTTAECRPRERTTAFQGRVNVPLPPSEKKQGHEGVSLFSSRRFAQCETARHRLPNCAPMVLHNGDGRKAGWRSLSAALPNSPTPQCHRRSIIAWGSPFVARDVRHSPSGFFKGHGPVPNWSQLRTRDSLCPRSRSTFTDVHECTLQVLGTTPSLHFSDISRRLSARPAPGRQVRNHGFSVECSSPPPEASCSASRRASHWSSRPKTVRSIIAGLSKLTQLHFHAATAFRSGVSSVGRRSNCASCRRTCSASRNDPPFSSCVGGTNLLCQLCSGWVTCTSLHRRVLRRDSFRSCLQNLCGCLSEPSCGWTTSGGLQCCNAAILVDDSVQNTFLCPAADTTTQSGLRNGSTLN